MPNKRFNSSLLAIPALAICSGSAMAADNCRPVHALIVDAKAADGCASPYGFCAAGTVEGKRGLNGTTYFVLDGIGTTAETAPGFSVTSGLLVYTTREGTLTVRETGMSKLSMGYGILTSVQEIVSGTGRFEGASGTLYNNAKDVNRTFYSHISGKLCLPAQRNAKQDAEGEWMDDL